MLKSITFQQLNSIFAEEYTDRPAYPTPPPHDQQDNNN